MAGRSSCHGGKARKGLRDVILGYLHIQGIFVELDLCTYSTDPASVGVNDTATHRNAGL
jgi:hypothetical protein